MLATPARYVSVSELYSTDEVELLLDEIRELEPTSCRGEDVQPAPGRSSARHCDISSCQQTGGIECGLVVQDFEIAGSGCGACDAAGGRSPGAAGGGRSPAGTERSWDSHAHYLRSPPRAPQPLAPLYCRPRYLLTLQGFCTLLIAVCGACAGGCVWGAVGTRLGGGGGAGGGAVRALQLGALSSALLHAALLTMRLTALHLLMPIDWDALSAVCCVWSAAWLCGGGGALLLSVCTHHAAAPAHIRDLFIAAISLAYVASAAGLAVVTSWARARCRAARARQCARGAYCAVPPAPEGQWSALPSTSRHAPL